MPTQTRSASLHPSTIGRPRRLCTAGRRDARRGRVWRTRPGLRTVPPKREQMFDDIV
ncbi:hypothetical protein T261_00471 [Streptomyces lydicus]|nr:hypothetical protein T261_00471 [Streptomyces lydicus]